MLNKASKAICSGPPFDPGNGIRMQVAVGLEMTNFQPGETHEPSIPAALFKYSEEDIP
jgi:hypothetical protein